ncbi:MAG: hypothetical protein ACD_4C00067G0006, partial [uncultured bacterium (gcode 4)]
RDCHVILPRNDRQLDKIRSNYVALSGWRLTNITPPSASSKLGEELLITQQVTSTVQVEVKLYFSKFLNIISIILKK